MDWRDETEFHDEMELQALVLLALVQGILPKINQEAAFDYILDTVRSYEGLDPELANDLGRALKSGAHLQNPSTTH